MTSFPCSPWRKSRSASTSTSNPPSCGGRCASSGAGSAPHTNPVVDTVAATWPRGSVSSSHASTLRCIVCRMSGSGKSVITTFLAPSTAAAMHGKPAAAPSSSTVLPSTRDGSASKWSVTTLAPFQSVCASVGL